MAAICFHTTKSNRKCNRVLDPVKDVSKSGKPWKTCSQCRAKYKSTTKKYGARDVLHTSQGSLIWARYTTVKIIAEKLGLSCDTNKTHITSCIIPLADEFMQATRTIARELVGPAVGTKSMEDKHNLFQQPDFLRKYAEELLASDRYRKIWGNGPDRCCTNNLDVEKESDYEEILYFIRCMIGKRSSDFIFKKAGIGARENGNGAKKARPDEEDGLAPFDRTESLHTEDVTDDDDAYNSCHSELPPLPTSRKRRAQEASHSGRNETRAITRQTHYTETPEETEQASSHQHRRTHTTPQESPPPTSPIVLDALSNVDITTPAITNTIFVKREIDNVLASEARTHGPPPPDLNPKDLASARADAFETLMVALECPNPQPATMEKLSMLTYKIYTAKVITRMETRLGEAERETVYQAYCTWASLHSSLIDFRNTTKYFGRCGAEWMAHKRELQKNTGLSWKESVKPAIEAYRVLGLLVDEMKREGRWPHDKEAFAKNVASFYATLLEQRGVEVEDLAPGFEDYNMELWGWFED